MKTLYSFSIDQEKEVEKTETKTGDNGETITVKTKVKEMVPVEFVIKKPSRSEREEADCIRAEYLSKFIRRGIISEAVLSKTYADQGGVLDEFQRKYYLEMQVKYATKSEEYKKLATDEPDNKDKSNEILLELVNLQQDIKTFLREQTVYYQNTAEARAKFKLIEYLFTHLVYWREQVDKDPVGYFKGATFEDKLKHLEELEEKEDDLFLQMREQALYVLSVFVEMDMNISKEGLEDIVKTS